jgi:hypothetical protein
MEHRLEPEFDGVAYWQPPKLWLIRGTILFDLVPINVTAIASKLPD